MWSRLPAAAVPAPLPRLDVQGSGKPLRPVVLGRRFLREDRGPSQGQMCDAAASAGNDDWSTFLSEVTPPLCPLRLGFSGAASALPAGLIVQPPEASGAPAS